MKGRDVSEATYKDFVWHARPPEGDIRVGDMSTQHLFFVIRMLWNHTAPEEDRIEPYRRYDLRMLDRDYVRTALHCIYQELCTRDDLTLYFYKCLSHMRDCILKRYPEPKRINSAAGEAPLTAWEMDGLPPLRRGA